jgi:tRNA pseudouridine55 synthase
VKAEKIYLFFNIFMEFLLSRRRSGENISCWVLVDKHAGISSSAVVNKVRWLFNAKKAGHAGTLDPEATGLLAIALGEATKTIPYITDSLKAYSFVIKFGAETTTDDCEGEITITSKIRPENEKIIISLKKFIGKIQQVPPQFSAVKIDGQRAYNLARANTDFTISSRPIEVERLNFINRIDKDHALFEMTCGKGGYVRSICRDLGRDLGCYGHTHSIRRLWSGLFNLENAYTVEDLTLLKNNNNLDQAITPLEASLKNIKEIPINTFDLGRVQNGNHCSIREAVNSVDEMIWVSYNGKAIALGNCTNGTFYPFKVLVNYPNSK